MLIKRDSGLTGCQLYHMSPTFSISHQILEHCVCPSHIASSSGTDQYTYMSGNISGMSSLHAPSSALPGSHLMKVDQVVRRGRATLVQVRSASQVSTEVTSTSGRDSDIPPWTGKDHRIEDILSMPSM